MAGWVAGGIALTALVLVASQSKRFLAEDGGSARGISLSTDSSVAQPVTQERTSSSRRQQTAALSDARRTPIVNAVRRIRPSVVSVNVIRRTRTARSSFFEEFFVPYGYEREVAGLGSGFAIASGGYVLTNAHVVEGAEEIVVATSDGTEHPAETIGLDELSDLALLRVEVEIPVPSFGNSEELVIGEPAIAIGNPFGYLLSNVEPTITVGVISGLGRHILAAAFSDSRQGGVQTIYADMIQTDASINPGNSGGPLVDAEGRVIGVNSAIFSRSGGSQGLGFAIPINRALAIADQLRTSGRVRRPWVGLDVGRSRGDQGGGRGATVVRVAPDSPADRADLRRGMELVAVMGRPVKSPLDWEAELFEVMPGEALTLTVRDSLGQERQITVEVEDLPSVRAERLEVLVGLELVTLTAAIRIEQGIRSSTGALIVDVSDDVSRVTGLARGDLIVAINRRAVESADDVADMIRFLSTRGAIRLHYERDGAIWSTTFRLEG